MPSTTPAIGGPAIIATLRWDEFSASALVRSWAGTMLGTIALRAGPSSELKSANSALAA